MDKLLEKCFQVHEFCTSEEAQTRGARGPPGIFCFVSNDQLFLWASVFRFASQKKITNSIVSNSRSLRSDSLLIWRESRVATAAATISIARNFLLVADLFNERDFRWPRQRRAPRVSWLVEKQARSKTYFFCHELRHEKSLCFHFRHDWSNGSFGRPNRCSATSTGYFRDRQVRVLDFV